MSLFGRVSTWFKEIVASKQRTIRRKDARLSRLLVEVLEDRLAPAIPAAIHIFELNGTFADSVKPAIVMTGPGGSLDATGYTFGDGQGPNTDVLVLPQNYAVEMRFTLDSSTLDDNFDHKLVDFRNRTTDSGLYRRNSQDTLIFYKAGVSVIASSPAASFPESGPIHLVLNRDGASKNVTAYINGVQQFSFVDSANDAAFVTKMQYLIDDIDEHSAGVLDYVRTYPGPLTAEEIDYLYQGGLPDVTEIDPPTVLSTTPIFVPGSVAEGTTSLQITFNEPVLGGTTSSNYELRSPGPDEIFANADDQVVAISTATYGGNTATLNFPALTAGAYRLTVKDTITDVPGNRLDGDADGTATGHWVRDLIVGDPLPAATHIFDLNGSFADAVIPTIVMTGPGGTLGAIGYTFAMEQGPNTDVIVTPQNYALEMKFTLDNTPVPGHIANKIVDFKNRSSDTGLYQDIGNSQLIFYRVGSGTIASGSLGGLPASGPIHLLLNRDGDSGMVTAYVNGVFQFSFADTTGAAIFQTKMNYLIDETTGGEDAAGVLDYVRTYPEPLTLAEVVYLHQGGVPAHRIVVTSTADAGPSTLRQAILDANQFSGPDLIEFAIAGAGPHTISLLSALPEITDAVTIDGSSQPGFVDEPLIELNGSGLLGIVGLRVLAPNVAIRGLAVSNFGGAGLFVDGAADVIASAMTIGSLAGAGSIQINGGTLTIGGDNTSTTFSGAISGTGGITKVGSGTFTLGGLGTYTGATVIEVGTLALVHAGSNNPITSSPMINVMAGATLDVLGLDNGAITDTLVLAAGQTLMGHGIVTGKTLVASGSIIAPGASAGSLHVGDISLASGSNFHVEIAGLGAGTEYDQLQVSGTVTLNGANLSITFGYTPALGDSFTLIDNDDGNPTIDPILGTRTLKIGGVAIPDGGMFYLSGKLFSLSYAGGQGANDLVLTRVAGNFVRGTYWNDLNANGRRDAGEPGLVGSTIYVDVNNNAQFDVGDFTTTTQANDPATAADEAGRYEFQLPTGTYTIRRVPQGNSAPSIPSLINGFLPASFAESRHVANVSSTYAVGRDFGDFTNRIVKFTTPPAPNNPANPIEAREDAGVVTIFGQVDTAFGRDAIIPVMVTGATAGKDYDILDTGMIFAANSTQGTYRLKIRTDGRFELAENVTFTLQPALGFVIDTPASRVLTIINIDPIPQVLFTAAQPTDPPADEGATVTVDVVLTGESDVPVTVPLIFLPDSTADSSQYQVDGSSTLVIPVGSKKATLTLRIKEDNTPENTQRIKIGFDPTTLINATVSTAKDAVLTRVVNIPRNDQPVVSFAKSEMKQKEEATTIIAELTMTSNPTGAAIDVPFFILTQDELHTGETAADGADRTIIVGGVKIGTNYVGGETLAGDATSGTLKIPANASSGIIRINIREDQINEPLESMVLVMGTPVVAGTSVNGVKGTNTYFALRIEDDDTPKLSFAKTNITELWEDDGTVTFTVTSTLASSTDVSIPIVVSANSRKSAAATEKGIARHASDGDFTASSKVTIPAGLKEGTGKIILKDDSTNEPSETFKLSLGQPPSGVTVNKVHSQTFTIKDNDPIIGIGPITKVGFFPVDEGTNRNFTVFLDHETNEDLVVSLLLGGTASKADYTIDATAPGISRISSLNLFIVTVPKGSIYSSPIKVKTVADTIHESVETITMQVLGVKSSSTTTSTLGIMDDDGPPTVFYATTDFPVNESNPGWLPITFSLSSVSGVDVYVKPSFIFDGAPPASFLHDYNRRGLDVNGYVKIPAGQLTGSFQIQMVDRAGYQGDRSFRMKISKAIEATAADSSVYVYIVDDEKPANNSAFGPGKSATGTGSQGFLEGATAFFDGNRNGVLDFLDINGDGIQGEVEPTEPSVLTDKDGSFTLLVPAEFDLDGSGVFETNEGRWAVVGGLDTSTGLPWTSRLYAPVGEFAVNPLTSLVEQLVRTQGMTLADAESRVMEAFSLASVDLGSFNPLEGLRAEDVTAGQYFATYVEVYNTVEQIAELFAGRAGDLPVDYFADFVYADIAAKISQPDATADMTDPRMIADVINGVSIITGFEFSENDMNGTATVIATGNAAIAELPGPYDQTYANAVVKIKKVFQGDAADTLHAVGAGTQAIADVVSSFTQPNLQARIDSAIVGNIFPSIIDIGDAQIQEGNDGTKILEFQVFMLGDHTDTATVDYATEDIGALAGSDYVATSGTLTWLPGDSTTKTIQITLNGDTDFEEDELLRVALSNGQNVLVRKPFGFGFILNDDSAEFSTTVEPEAGANTFVIAHSDLRAGFELNGESISDGSYFEPLTLAVAGQDNVDDRLVLDFIANTYRSDVITFDGGDGSSIDSAEIRGGNFATVTQNLTNATDGQTLLRPVGSETDLTFRWFGLEPFLIAAGNIDDMIFELPAGVTSAIFEDADSTDEINAGMMQLRSPTGAFETTIFTNPTKSLVIRGSDGGGSVVIASTDPAFTGVILTLGTLTSPREAGSAVTANGLATTFGSGSFTRSWNVHQDGSTTASFTGGDTSSFSFTPNAVGSFRIVFAADDGAGAIVQDETSVVVVDTTAPNFTAPADITIEAASASGAVVFYTLPTASDIVDGPVAVDADAASGSTFPIGTTTVHLSTTDAHGNNTTRSFTVTVQDTTPPVISGTPANQTVEATGLSGAVVTYTLPTASDLVDGPVNVDVDIPSDSTFPYGATTVHFSATDAHGNNATSSFTVTVQDTTPPVINGVPNDGAAADIDFQISETTLNANWAGIFADAQSGITSYQWKVGTTAGGSELFDFTSTGIVGTSATNNSLMLTQGQGYFVTVRATNGSGLLATATSDGVTVPYGDNFNGPDSPTLGPKWTTVSGGVRVSSGIGVGNPDAISMATLKNPVLSDVIVEADFSNVTASAARAGLLARYSGSGEFSSNFYLGMVWKNPLTGKYEAYLFVKLSGQGYRQLGITKDLTGVFSGNGVLRLELVGNQVRLFVNNVLQVIAYDSTLTAPGLVGMRGMAFSLEDFNAKRVEALPTSLPFADHFANSQNGAHLDRVWTEQLGVFTIQDQQAVADPAAGISIATLNAPPVADAIVQVDVKVTTVGSHAGLLARYSGPAQRNFYVGLIYHNPNGVYQAYLFVNHNGVFTQLAVQNLQGFAGAGAIRFEVVGKQLKLFVNGVLKALAYDSSIPGSGLVAIRGLNASIDQFSASAVTAQTANVGFTDHFTNTDNSDLDRIWTERLGAFTTQNDRAVDAASLAGVSMATMNRAPGSNAIVQADVTLRGTGSGAGLVARYSGPDQSNFYLGMVFNNNGVYQAYLFRNQGGLFTQLAVQNLTDFTGSGHLRFEVVGTQLKVLVDGVQKVTAIDSVLTSGLVGIRAANAELDNFNAT